MSELKIRKHAWPYIKNFRTYIDIGACQGDTTNPFIEEFQRVISFEPNVSVFDKISDKAVKYNLALGDQDGEVTLVLPNGIDKPGHGSIVRYNSEEWITAPRIVSKITTLDSFQFEDVDFIKIDVEHYEMNVCLGAEKTIKKYMPTIFFENKRDEAEHVRLWLESLGYKTIKHRSDTTAYKE
jgi:FkbM family methyltransferase